MMRISPRMPKDEWYFWQLRGGYIISFMISRFSGLWRSPIFYLFNRMNGPKVWLQFVWWLIFILFEWFEARTLCFAGPPLINGRILFRFAYCNLFRVCVSYERDGPRVGGRGKGQWFHLTGAGVRSFLAATVCDLWPFKMQLNLIEARSKKRVTQLLDFFTLSVRHFPNAPAYTPRCPFN